jgi:5-methylcytosine-specific restriction protein A
MAMLDLQRLEATLTASMGLGLSVQPRETENGLTVRILPTDVHPHHGFGIDVQVGWRSAVAVFVPGPFALEFVELMGAADEHARASFEAVARQLRERKVDLDIRINGSRVNPTDSSQWPHTWQSLEIRLASRPFDRTDASAEREFREVLFLCEGMLALVLSLAAEPISTVEAHEIDPSTAGYPEGALVRVVANRYERDPRNRALAIAIHGTICRGCGFDFEAVYGAIGRGYIELHHVVPVAKMGEHYRVNPTTDLVPVCPNCHAMLHRRNPPLTVEQLQRLIRADSRAVEYQDCGLQ